MRITLLVTVDVEDDVARELVEDAERNYPGAGPYTVAGVLADEVRSTLEYDGAATVRVEWELVPALQAHFLGNINDEPTTAAIVAVEELVQWTRGED